MSDETGSGGGLLSKVVRFVKSPTTHWSDLDRPPAEESEGESRLALKEMIERKRRNDFVRSREFDMLRKLRRREVLAGGPNAAAPSFYPSSQPADTGERARTLRKIDEIEAQMSTGWIKRHGAGVAPQAPVAPGGHSPGSRAYDKTDPMPLVEPRGVPMPLGGFAPTQKIDLEQASAPMHAPVAPLLGDVPEFNVEVLAAVKQDPEIEEAAIRFANGDAAGAEAVLLALVAEGGGRRDDLHTWLTLFDLYRCVGNQARFDDTAAEFAARFGRSAPQWALVAEPESAPAPVAASSSAVVGASVFHWSCPSTVGPQSLAALRATLERHPPPWHIDWRQLKTIELAALPGLIEVFKGWADAPVRLKMLGAEGLLDLLVEYSPTGDRGVDPQWWAARLAVLRVLGEMDEFDLAALNYCVTYEVSPPAWEDPVCSCRDMTEDGHTVMPSQFDAALPSELLPFGATVDPRAGGGDSGAGESSGDLAKTALEGEYTGSAEAALRPLAHQGKASHFEFNCRQLRRVDFGAAGDLLNWCVERQARGHSVTFKQVNRLVAAFFGVIGITEAARVLLRAD